ncbi:hypothetical protein ABVK25_012505, partial [Lepraria finkii]
MNDWAVSIAIASKPDEFTSVLIDAYTDLEDNTAPYVTARPPRACLQTISALPEVNDWLEGCKLHRECPKQDDVRLPTRLVDVGSDVSSDVVKIWHSEGTTGRYAALSYCWGGPQDGALQSGNLEQYQQAIDIKKLSKTIRDAIK